MTQEIYYHEWKPSITKLDDQYYQFTLYKYQIPLQEGEQASLEESLWDEILVLKLPATRDEHFLETLRNWENIYKSQYFVRFHYTILKDCGITAAQFADTIKEVFKNLEEMWNVAATEAACVDDSVWDLL